MNELITVFEKMGVDFEKVTDKHIKIPLPIGKCKNVEDVISTAQELDNIDFDGCIHIEEDKNGNLNWLGVTREV